MIDERDLELAWTDRAILMTRAREAARLLTYIEIGSVGARALASSSRAGTARPQVAGDCPRWGSQILS